MSGMDMVVDIISSDASIGIGSVDDIHMTDKRQCASFSVVRLYNIIKAFKDIGAKEVYVTVENNKAIVIGGKNKGIILAIYD